MVIKARHHLLIYWFFRHYAGWIIKRHFGRIEIKQDFDDGSLPVLLLANHISWWDGFFAMFFNEKILRRKFHFMMLEKQLQKYSFFNSTGGYSVRKGSSTIIDSLNYTAELLRDCRNMVLLFPQGKITSVYTKPIRFEKGIEWIVRRTGEPIQILFMANLIDYFSNRKPGLYIYISDYKGDKMDAKSMEEAYNLFYNRCIAMNNLNNEQ